MCIIIFNTYYVSVVIYYVYCQSKNYVSVFTRVTLRVGIINISYGRGHIFEIDSVDVLQ